MSDFLVVYLDSIDERLLEYLDEDDELKLDVVQRLRFYTSALLDRSITAEHVWEDWADWYQLVAAFVATYATGGRAPFVNIGAGHSALERSRQVHRVRLMAMANTASRRRGPPSWAHMRSRKSPPSDVSRPSLTLSITLTTRSITGCETSDVSPVNNRTRKLAVPNTTGDSPTAPTGKPTDVGLALRLR